MGNRDAALRVTVTSKAPRKLGRLFSAKITELGLASVPGMTGRGGGGFSGAQVIVHWPALIDSRHVTERLHLPSGEEIDVMPTQRLGLEAMHYQRAPQHNLPVPGGETISVPLGRLFGTRSGDKGGAANCGVWARSDAGYAFLAHYLTVDEFKRLCPDMASYEIDRYEMPNLRALNFYIRGVLGGGASAAPLVLTG